MAFFKTLTQGGQVHVHQLRMLRQILVIGNAVSFLVGAGHFTWKSFDSGLGPGPGPNSGLSPIDWRQAYEVYWAKFMLATTPSTKHKNLKQLYMPLRGQPYQRRCISVVADAHLQRTTARVETFVKETRYESLKFAGWTFLSIMGLWFILGLAQRQTHHQRGNTLVPWRKLAFLLKCTFQASDLGFKVGGLFLLKGKLPLVKNKETSHILITGTTGSGKSNAFHHLLPQIRKRGDRTIVVDLTGDYISRYYQEKKDIILNPLDLRSLPWHPWADCHLDSHYDVLAESFIQPKNAHNDPFWDNASRAVFKAALRKYAAQGDADVEKLYNFLLSSADKEFEDFFKHTEAATFSFKNSEKTTHSIRSVLSSQIECLRQLDPTATPFSIRKWVINNRPSLFYSPNEASRHSTRYDGGWIFITARADQRQTLTPLISAWVDVALNALMVLPADPKRRLWFVIDELAALQKLPGLQAGLAEGRKYGGCLLIGFQSKPQLEDIYGQNAAEAMLDLFNTKIFFRCTEPSTQQWISKVLGDKEEIEPQENISYGAHSMRDGVSLSHHTRQRPLIMPAELSQLRDLECYLKYPGNYPCTRIQTKYQKTSFFKIILGHKNRGKEAFLLKREKKREYIIQTQDPKAEILEEKMEELI